ncbi:MAG: hypothetical protein JWQ71_3335 [Pedosphaera sp.]|nr:hypothetical protein [Pedosphaera sp.]
MILAFADDSSVTVFDDVAQANRYCEGADVENGVWTFTDERGYFFKPIFTEPKERKVLFGLASISSDPFTLILTGQRNTQLLEDVLAGRISVDNGPTKIQTNDQLKDVLRLG